MNQKNKKKRSPGAAKFLTLLLTFFVLAGLLFFLLESYILPYWGIEEGTGDKFNISSIISGGDPDSGKINAAQAEQAAEALGSADGIGTSDGSGSANGSGSAAGSSGATNGSGSAVGSGAANGSGSAVGSGAAAGGSGATNGSGSAAGGSGATNGSGSAAGGSGSAGSSDTLVSYAGTGTRIPAYSGTDTTQINGDIPFFTDEWSCMDEGEISLSEFDSLGRCGAAMMKACTEALPTVERGATGQSKPSGWVQKKYDVISQDEPGSPGYLYNRTHLLMWALSGLTDDERNLITGTRHFNLEMLKTEEKVLKRVKEGDTILYRVTPVFEGSNLLAQGVLIEASDADGSWQLCRFVYNVQPGIILDYSDGESQEE